jgi:putative flippase GtrA
LNRVNRARALINFAFVRFLFVGVLNTVFGYLVFLLMSFLGLHYWMAILVATCTGVVFNFFTIGRLVFNNENNVLFVRFCMVYAVTYLLNIGFIRIAKLIIGNVLLIQGILAFPLAVFSFSMNRLFVFKYVNPSGSSPKRDKNGKSGKTAEPDHGSSRS